MKATRPSTMAAPSVKVVPNGVGRGEPAAVDASVAPGSADEIVDMRLGMGLAVRLRQVFANKDAPFASPGSACTIRSRSEYRPQTSSKTGRARAKRMKVCRLRVLEKRHPHATIPVVFAARRQKCAVDC